ncbi:hypothetical protein [Streptomyces mutabilis]|uniref:hypothetical protein n=1 Tax=Streptomyces mutabilis TaxID=67332 RepID=UPI0039858916
MTERLDHALGLFAHGLLTELPAQLITAAIVAAVAAAARAHKRSRGAKHDGDVTE